MIVSRLSHFHMSAANPQTRTHTGWGKLTGLTLAVMLVIIGQPEIAYSQVYKSVAPDGSISYSDGPSTPNQAPESVTTLPTYIAPKITATPTAPTAKPKQKEPTQYQAIRILSPSPDATIWDNSGTINVQVETQPNLNTEAGDRVVVYIDGKQAGDPAASTTASASGIDRGSHQVSVSVLTREGATTIQSETITVHLQRHSIHSPARQPPPPVPRP